MVDGLMAHKTHIHIWVGTPPPAGHYEFFLYIYFSIFKNIYLKVFLDLTSCRHFIWQNEYTVG